MIYFIILLIVFFVWYFIWFMTPSNEIKEPNKYQVGDIVEFLFYTSNKTMRGSGEILKVKDPFHYGKAYVIESIATYESILFQREWQETKCFDVKEEDIIRKVK